MQSSTAQRERLVSPLSLALMAGLFGVAFFVLKPDSVPGLGVPTYSSKSDGDVTIDELSLAYLRAQSATGKVSDDDIISVVARLVKAGRLGEVQQLLAQNQTLDIGEVLRFEIDLAGAAVDSDVSLYAALKTLVDSPYLHQPALLKRGVRLSKPLEQPRMTATLYSLWAEKSDNHKQALENYLACARYLESVSQPVLAVECLQEAKTIVHNDSDIVEINLAMLPLSEQGSLQRESLTNELLDSSTMSIAQLQRAAETLLQLERPDAASRLYARLAMEQPARVGEWLPLAARWAQAAGKPVEAAVFLDALANDTGPGKPDLQARQQLQQEVEALLLEAGRSKEVYARMQARIDNTPADNAMLKQGVALARQLGEYSQALDWNTQLLSSNPDDEHAVRVQRELALAAGNLPLALRWAERVVQLYSRSVDDREKLARISEWNGKPDLALQHWQWLAKNASNSVHFADSKANQHGLDTRNAPALGAAVGEAEPGTALDRRIRALREVVRLAELTLRPDQAAQALRKITLFEKPTNSDIVKLVALYELDGRADAASIALQDIIVLNGPERFILHILATHEFHHSRYAQSLSAWEQYADNFGHSTESTLSRMELLWRMDQKDAAAQIADLLKGRSQLSAASDYQLLLMAEIGWQYRKPWLTLLVQPRLDRLDGVEQQAYYGLRSVELLQEEGKEQQALVESMRLWNTTRNVDFAFLSMQLAVKLDDKAVLAQFKPGHDTPQVLQEIPYYWAQVAADRLRDGDSPGAAEAYTQALTLDVEHVESIAGLIWMAIDKQDDAGIQRLLEQYRDFALDTPALWQPMAMGYLQTGTASSSLPWFNRLLDQIETDYGMLLTYADALEYAGRGASAHKVRQYTLQQLRPLLVEGSTQEQALLIRQYSRLSARYAGAEPNEQLFTHLLKTGAQDGQNAQDDLWRQDMAISWLMSTQQFEHARVVMAQIHERRLQAPAWQQVAMALEDKDDAALNALVQASGSLSVGNHILALRQLGNDRDAYALVQQVMSPGAPLAGSNLDDVRMAQAQYVSLRDARPSFMAGFVDTRTTGQLDVNDTGVRVRHTFSRHDLGMSLDLTQRQLDSDRYDLSGRDELSDVALSLFFGTARQGGRLTTGFLSAEDDDLFYGSAGFARRLRNQRSQVSAELAYSEEITLSPELQVGARQHRLSVGYDADIGRREFVRVQADATQINTRVEQNKVARGLGGSVELGVRGSFGSNTWSTSVRAAHVDREREQELPEQLRLSARSTMDSVLAAQVQSLSVGGSLSRGGINTDFPQVSSPRYYLSASLGHSWPDKVVGVQVGAGAGIRVIGGDELSLSFSHDTQPTIRHSGSATAIGISYRYHFQ